MTKIVAIFLVASLVWVAVTWFFDPASLATGGLIALVLAFALRQVELDEVRVLLLPRRLLWALAYIPVLFFYIVRANLDVAYRVLHPALPIRPGIVRARTSLRSPAGRVLLANSLTLTPGTLSVDLEGDVLYVHRIYVPEGDADAITERSLARFEAFIRRIFE
jgi:multicomponent Na+:H+ antiporter subunit E